MAWNWKTFFTDILAVGETLTPVFIHNPKSQTITTILTTDVNALLAQLNAQPQQQAPVQAQPVQVVAGTQNPNPLV